MVLNSISKGCLPFDWLIQGRMGAAHQQDRAKEGRIVEKGWPAPAQGPTRSGLLGPGEYVHRNVEQLKPFASYLEWSEVFVVRQAFREFWCLSHARMLSGSSC